MKKTESNGYVYDFSVDYDIAVDDILDIYKYLMKKKMILNNVWIYLKNVSCSDWIYWIEHKCIEM